MVELQDLLFDIDSAKVRECVRDIRKKDRGLSKEEIARKIINRKAIENGILGAGTGALGIAALLVTIPADTVKLLRAEAFLFKCINYVYGIDPDDDSINYLFPLLISASDEKEFTNAVEDTFETFWGDIRTEEFIIDAVKEMAMKAARKQIPDVAAKFAVKQFGKGTASYVLKGMPKHLAKTFWRFGGRKFTERAAAKTFGKAIPILGAISGFALDWYSVQKKGELAIKFHEEGVISWACSLFAMESPTIDKIADGQGSSDSLIFIHGYLTKDSNSLENRKQWVDKLRKSGWKGAIYHCWWDSSDGVGMLLDILPHSHFKKYQKIAAIIGSHFIPEYAKNVIPFSSEITFIGHSLGAKTLFNSMKVWNPTLPRIRNVILLGGAIDCSLEEWEIYSNKVSGKVVNVFNQDDPDLNKFYKLIHDHTPCGLSPITANTSNVINIDGSQYIQKTHFCHAYLDFFLSNIPPYLKISW